MPRGVCPACGPRASGRASSAPTCGSSTTSCGPPSACAWMRHGREAGSVDAAASPRTLLGGLLRCGVCGGAMIAANKRYYGCAAHKDRGPAVCTGTFAPRGETERRLVSELRDQVLGPDAVARIGERVRQLLADLERQAMSDIEATPARIAAAEAEVARLVDAVAEMGLSDALKRRLKIAEDELEALKKQRTTSKSCAVPDRKQIEKRVRDVIDPNRDRTRGRRRQGAQDPRREARAHHRRGA